MGAAFRKFPTLRTDYLRVLARRFLNFWNRPLPIPSQLTRGKGAPVESFTSPSTRRVPLPPGQEEPGQNGGESFLSLMDIILRTRSPVLTKFGNCKDCRNKGEERRARVAGAKRAGGRRAPEAPLDPGHVPLRFPLRRPPGRVRCKGRLTKPPLVRVSGGRGSCRASGAGSAGASPSRSRGRPG
jgi:hypothetical protein